MNVFDEFLTIAAELERQRVEYALVGGVALAFYSIPRMTQVLQHEYHFAALYEGGRNAASLRRYHDRK